MAKAVTLDDLRRYAVARSLFPPTTLARAIAKLGFIQADPIRAPARAQDLTLRHRVKDYRAGDLERRYPTLDLEEGMFVNYGFLRRADYQLMHPRDEGLWDARTKRRAHSILEFIREHGTAHPRDVEARFSHGKTTNYWGGSSNAATHLLNSMHYRGLLRVASRESGIRVYAVQEPTRRRDHGQRGAQLDALIDIIVHKYAPLPALSLNGLVYRLRYSAPQWAAGGKAALRRAKERLAHAHLDTTDRAGGAATTAGVDTWYWPSGEDPSSRRYIVGDEVRLLSPFDPVVWDRRRFEWFWRWAYRFEAYTPAPKRIRGYYALPLLWRDHVVGWANVTVASGRPEFQIGFVDQRPSDRAFAGALEAELDRFRRFLIPKH